LRVATGLVGQRLVQRIASHPWFTLGALGASERSAGRAYREAARWMLAEPMPAAAADARVGACTPEAFASCDLVLSALDAPVAKDVEPALAGAGIAVVSNSSAYRMAGTSRS
jgi:aspartate-semialdehyde dehydrogenase